MTAATITNREKLKEAAVESIAYRKHSIFMIVEIRPNIITVNMSDWTC